MLIVNIFYFSESFFTNWNLFVFFILQDFTSTTYVSFSRVGKSQYVEPFL